MPPRDERTSAHRRTATASDRTLARRIRLGDRDALEALVRRYVRPVHAVAASYLAEAADVEDAAQETFLRALRALDGYDSTRPFAPWLYQIARNVARNRLAGRDRTDVGVAPGAVPSELPGPDLLLERAEVRARVEAEVARLPERQRTVFRLCDVEGYAAVEVASLMGLSPGTVRSHLHHARRTLRAVLTASFEGSNTGG